MTIELKAGARFRSAVCTTEVIVVKAAAGDIDLRCGGQPVIPAAEEAPAGGAPEAPFDTGSAIGKRYVDEGDTFEILCTKAGAGSLSVGDAPLQLKGAKPLPASD